MRDGNYTSTGKSLSQLNWVCIHFNDLVRSVILEYDDVMSKCVGSEKHIRVHLYAIDFKHTQKLMPLCANKRRYLMTSQCDDIIICDADDV